MEDQLPTTADDVIKIMKSLPNLVKGFKDAKGVPLEYKLLPLAAIEKVVLQEENPTDRIVQSIDNAIISECELKMEGLFLAKQKFNYLYERVKDNEHLLNGQLLVDFNILKTKTTKDEKAFFKNLSENLVQVIIHFYWI